jgi:uncharacterized protein (TIGR02466 family)
MEFETRLGKINVWFPRSVYVADNVLVDELEDLKDVCKNTLSSLGFLKNNMLSVDSTHKTKNDLYNDQRFKNLKDKILEHSALYLSELGYNEECVKKLQFTDMWCNISKKDDFIFPHVHSNSLLSGVFYIKSSQPNKIRFFKDPTNMLLKPTEYNIFNYEYCDYDCVPGRLLLFLSDFLHGNERQESEEKIAVSFNLTCSV